MSRNIWFSSDLHLFHRNILTFKDQFGRLTRGSKFDNIDQMNDCILTKHNERVKDGDIWYCLGDLTFSYGDDFAQLISKFKGRKRLIPGNHDDIKKLVQYFQKVQIWRVFRDPDDAFIPFTATHVPIGPGSIKGKHNVHGHTHENLVTIPGISGINDTRYINVCMEHTNYAPISFDEIQAIMSSISF